MCPLPRTPRNRVCLLPENDWTRLILCLLPHSPGNWPRWGGPLPPPFLGHRGPGPSNRGTFAGISCWLPSLDALFLISTVVGGGDWHPSLTSWASRSQDPPPLADDPSIIFKALTAWDQTAVGVKRHVFPAGRGQWGVDRGEAAPCPLPGVQGLGHGSCSMASPFLSSPGLLSL